MPNNLLGILIGGLIPALLFGLFAILTKASTQQELNTSIYIITVGFACIILGLLSLPLLSDSPGKISPVGVTYAACGGLAWAGGMVLVNVALSRFQAPIALLAPLYNMNTLVAVLLGLWIFAEWRGVSTPTLMLGAFLITLGGIIVSKA